MTDLFSRRLVPSANAYESRVGEETVILNLGNDTYYGLDSLGTRIWEMLREGLSLTAILGRLAEEYDIETSQAKADMRRFLEELLEHDLLVDA